MNNTQERMPTFPPAWRRGARIWHRLHVWANRIAWRLSPEVDASHPAWRVNYWLAARYIGGLQ